MKTLNKSKRANMLIGLHLNSVEDFGAKKGYQAELGVTDLDYLLESARKYGKTVYAYESTIYVKNEVYRYDTTEYLGVE